MSDKNFSSELLSKVIDYLRFPLIVGVVFIHNYSGTVEIPNGTFGGETFHPMFYYCSNLFSQILGHISVPLFFFISGFLFFWNVKKIDRKTYCNKLRIRTKTLLIPYLFWNLLAIGIFAAIALSPTLKSLVNRDMEYSLQAFCLYLFGAEIAFQFWFIRDLIVVVILSPLIYALVKYTKIYGVIILCILWLFSNWYNDIACLAFFSFGAYFGINKRNPLNDFGRTFNLSFIIYPVMALTDLLTKDYSFNFLIHKIGIIIGIIFCFNLVTHLFKKNKIKPIPFLSDASFFIFAIHQPFILTGLKRFIYVFFKPESDVALTSLYFLIVIVVVMFGLVSYYVLKRFLPRFTAIITGGR
jgi:surface polysaccharide O-acyltransferase-like enzyme